MLFIVYYSSVKISYINIKSHYYIDLYQINFFEKN